MKERPILMTPENAQAVFEGRKSQTRRIVKPQPAQPLTSMISILRGDEWWCHDAPAEEQLPPSGDLEYSDGTIRPLAVKKVRSWKCPFGQAGERLWVRECWGDPSSGHPRCPDGRKPQMGDRIVYRGEPADDYQWSRCEPGVWSGWRPSIHMPRWAARSILEIYSVRVERLNDISEDDARAEGCEIGQSIFEALCETGEELRSFREAYAREHFKELWESIHGKGSWEANKFVWVIEFKKVGNVP